jgi:heme exporter protein A
MKSDNLELDGLQLARDGVALLSPISRQFAAGEIVAITGPNGAGKSTLLKAIAGLVRPMAGQVRWNAEPITRHGDYPRMVCHLNHKRGIEPGRRVGEQVAFWARAHGQPELADAALHYFDLTPWQDHQAAMLSAGWQQRLALARLIVQPGSLWLLDEPTSHLDADGIGLLHSLIQTRSERGGIILIATHIPLAGDHVRTLDLAPYQQAAMAQYRAEEAAMVC